ncbi:hypothetical protein [Mycobacterium marseillense]|uniref:hypothetical protein n=1 Tax=Mycobacterium marseillense TaxID=701042 RepID=UPI00119E3CDA|nr:hypothetical protein [Mycobacterium marseillense]
MSCVPRGSGIWSNPRCGTSHPIVDRSARTSRSVAVTLSNNPRARATKLHECLPQKDCGTEKFGQPDLDVVVALRRRIGDEPAASRQHESDRYAQDGALDQEWHPVNIPPTESGSNRTVTSEHLIEHRTNHPTGRAGAA